MNPEYLLNRIAKETKRIAQDHNLPHWQWVEKELEAYGKEEELTPAG